MNKDLQSKLRLVEDMIGTQKNCIPISHCPADYMHGMANGMILVHSIFADSKPAFVSRPVRNKERKIRHKCNKRRK